MADQNELMSKQKKRSKIKDIFKNYRKHIAEYLNDLKAVQKNKKAHSIKEKISKCTDFIYNLAKINYDCKLLYNKDTLKRVKR